MLNLTRQEQGRLQKLNEDEQLVEALKKFFLSSFTKKTVSSDVQTLAAERMAIELLHEGFKELSRIRVERGDIISKVNPA